MVHMDAPPIIELLGPYNNSYTYERCIYPNLIQKIFSSTTKNILNILKFDGIFPIDIFKIYYI